MLAIPDDMEYHGRGPMLSARRIDLNLLWRRAEQIQRVCEQVRCNAAGPQALCEGSFWGFLRRFVYMDVLGTICCRRTCRFRRDRLRGACWSSWHQGLGNWACTPAWCMLEFLAPGLREWSMHACVVHAGVPGILLLGLHCQVAWSKTPSLMVVG